MFSAGNKNLICPDSVGSFKREINGTNYDLITSSDNEDNAKKLKDMTKICVVLDSNNAQQWDTFFENNVQKKDKNCLPVARIIILALLFSATIQF